MSLPNLKLISAGAGSGKTYRLTQEMTELLVTGETRASGIIATTFTKKAAAELRERVRVKLLREGLSKEANELKNALIGTVHGLGVKLLKRFAFEAGVSPQVDIIADQDHQRLFNLSMAAVISVDTIERIEELCVNLSLSAGGEKYEWRRDVLNLVDIIRGNNFDEATIARSKEKSWAELSTFLPPISTAPASAPSATKARLETALSEVAAALENNEADGTKKTLTAARTLKKMLGELKRRGSLPWASWYKLALFDKDVGAKSRELVEPVVALGEAHPALPAFQADLKDYQDLIFDAARDAIAEYDRYKKARGRIDYTDMEVLVLQLLDNENVRATLRRELDLLMVDEFQDTSPIQLALFLKLSTLAKRSVWVGDPKQSIYGFRGAEPRLMKAVMDATGPMDPANIQKFSWRSREDVVYTCNALFTKAFHDMPPTAVVLEPKRARADESEELASTSGIRHWRFQLEAKQRFAKDWFYDMTAKAIRETLANPPLIQPKGGGGERRLRAGDIAVLMRTNGNCVKMAGSLNKMGLPAAIARNGLLGTAEATLLLACLKYMLSRTDSLSVAEIMLFGQRTTLPEIIENRLDYLERDSDADRGAWAAEQPFIQRLNDLRAITAEHSTSEMLNLLLERLDLRRVIVAWGEGEQRLSNVDELRRLAVEYEDNCHRQHRAASLGGYLLYLDTLKRADQDRQGASERPEAVNVLTYHKSKGLEWPMVVVGDLDGKPRSSLWGLAVVPEREEVDLADPLAGRYIRYWVNPYGRSSKPIAWTEALEASTWQTTANEESLGEDARLLYVGCTRARDYLVFPTAKPGTPWLDRVFARGGGVVPVLPDNSDDAPFDWGGHTVNKQTLNWTEPRNLPGSPVNFTPIPFIDGLRKGRAPFVPAVDTPTWLLETFGGADAGAVVTYHSPAAPDPATDTRLLQQLTANLLLGDAVDSAAELRLERAEQLCRNYLPADEVHVADLLEQSTAFRRWLAGIPGEVHRNVALENTLEGRNIHRTLDWVVRDENGATVIVTAPAGPGKPAEQERAGFAEANLARELAERAGLGPVRTTYLHWPLRGTLQELA